MFKYERISFLIHKGVFPQNYGSQDHKEFVWQWCREAAPFVAQGTIIKSGRWFQTHERSVPSMQYWPAVELVGTYIGLVDGWAGNSTVEEETATAIPDEPVCAALALKPGVASHANAMPNSASAEEAEKKQFVAHSNKDLNEMFDKATNMLHITTLIVGNEPVRVQWSLTVECAAPVVSQHNFDILAHKTREGCRKWRIDMANGNPTPHPPT